MAKSQLSGQLHLCRSCDGVRRVGTVDVPQCERMYVRSVKWYPDLVPESFWGALMTRVRLSSLICFFNSPPCRMDPASNKHTNRFVSHRTCIVRHHPRIHGFSCET